MCGICASSQIEHKNLKNLQLLEHHFLRRPILLSDAHHLQNRAGVYDRERGRRDGRREREEEREGGGLIGIESGKKKKHTACIFHSGVNNVNQAGMSSEVFSYPIKIERRTLSNFSNNIFDTLQQYVFEQDSSAALLLLLFFLKTITASAKCISGWQQIVVIFYHLLVKYGISRDNWEERCASHLFPGTWPRIDRPLPELCPPRSGSGCSPPGRVWTRVGRSEGTRSGTSEGGTGWNWPPRPGSLWWSWSSRHTSCWDTEGQNKENVDLEQKLTAGPCPTICWCMSPSGGQIKNSTRRRTFMSPSLPLFLSTLWFKHSAHSAVHLKHTH